VIDLDAATPVVVYRAPAAQPEPVAEMPVADVWEAPAVPVDALAEIAAVEGAALEGPPPLWGFDEDGQPLPSEAVAEEPEPPADAELVEAPETLKEPEPVDEPEPPAELPAPMWATAEELEAAIADQEPAGDDTDDEPQGLLADGARDEVAETLDLAEALRRAATQMESDGVVPAPGVEELASRSMPESESGSLPADEVVAESTPSNWPWEADEDAAVADGDGAPTQTVPEAPASESEEPQDAEPDLAEADAESVWAPAAMPAFTPVGIEDAGLEDIALLTPVVGESLADSRPVIVGEYPDVEPAGSAAEEIADGVETAEPEAAEESMVEAPAEIDAQVASETPFTTDDAIEEQVPEAPPELEAKVYEPNGVDIAAYTCDDCIYVETCPKAKQEGPATCGSFQWKSV